MSRAHHSRSRLLRVLPYVAIGLVSAFLSAAGVWRFVPRVAPVTVPSSGAERAAAAPAKATPGPGADVSRKHEPLTFPQDSWPQADLQIAPAQRDRFVRTVRLTGKVTLDTDHLAHIFPLVSGRVDEVKVNFGDRVKKGDLLVVVQSKEVGEAMLDLYQSRLQRDFAETKDQWIRDIDANTRELIQAIVQQVPVESIEHNFSQRPMGEFRDKLLSAYVSLRKTSQTFERLSPLSQQGVLPAKQLFEAEADRNADRVRLQSWIETIQQESRQAVLISAQAVKEARTRVAVNETNLRILGFPEQALADIDPHRQGEAISHYPVTSPFDGVIISKDVVLLERVNPDSQILSIADLSRVWITTDIFEEHLPLLQELDGKTIHITSNVWPQRSLPAQVFYTGDIVDEVTRTVGMRAVADNHEGLLRPGMFVNVELPEVELDDVLQVPSTAVLDHEGHTFVFVHEGGDSFRRHDVVVGRQNATATEILEGLQAGDQVVTRGGFALKSRMLAELLSGE